MVALLFLLGALDCVAAYYHTYQRWGYVRPGTTSTTTIAPDTPCQTYAQYDASLGYGQSKLRDVSCTENRLVGLRCCSTEGTCTSYCEAHTLYSKDPNYQQKPWTMCGRWGKLCQGTRNTYESAEFFCRARGMEICSRHRLEGRECLASGCLHNFREVYVRRDATPPPQTTTITTTTTTTTSTVPTTTVPTTTEDPSFVTLPFLLNGTTTEAPVQNASTDDDFDDTGVSDKNNNTSTVDSPDASEDLSSDSDAGSTIVEPSTETEATAAPPTASKKSTPEEPQKAKMQVAFIAA
eukprot:GEMP01075938.1.p1 GENE.GEMP01075938.1~~GEMP01075938.1.p1  ORF type:complete len:311 (+),score=53.06 GEMP01075938.1:54-935(+)